MEKKINYHQERINVMKPKSIVIGDSIAAGLARYPEVWLQYFKNALNLGIGGDRVEHVLWRVENLDLSSSIQDIVLQCGTNSLENDSPMEIANSITCIALTIMKKIPKVNVVVTGLLPRDCRL